MLQLLRQTRHLAVLLLSFWLTTTVQAGAGTGNQAPVAGNDSASTSAGESVEVLVLENDRDPDEGPQRLAVVEVGSPQNGSLLVLSGGSILRYTPNPGFSGSDSFSYVISDGLARAEAQVIVTVIDTTPETPGDSGNRPPQAFSDTIEVLSGDAVTINPLANDSDPDGTSIRLVRVSQPALGSVSQNGNNVRYQAPSGLSEVALTSFIYTISDGQLQASGRVTVLINPSSGGGQGTGNIAPNGTITAPSGNVTINPGDSLSFTATAVDPDGDDGAVSYRWTFDGGRPASSSAQNPGPIRFSEAGMFRVSLTAVDAAGLNDPSPASLTVTVLSTAAPVPSGARLRIDGDASPTVAFNQNVNLSVSALDAADQPLSGVAVVWRLQALGPGTDSASLAEARQLTDADGGTSNALRVGSQPRMYRVIAGLADGTSEATFLITVGTAALADADTPEAAAGRALDIACPALAAGSDSLNSAQQDLLQRCQAIIAAAGGDDVAEVRNAQREISPSEAPLAGRVGMRVATQQFSNIGTRLFVLRSGRASDNFLQGLSLSSGSSATTALSGALLQQWFSSQGGGAGDEDEPTEPDDDPFSRLAFFATGAVSLGGRDNDDQEDGFDLDTLGLTVGLDYRFSNQLVLGLALGYADSNADLDAGGGRLDTDSLSVSAYGNVYLNDHLYLDGVAIVGRNDNDSTRSIRYQIGDTEQVDRSAQAEFDSSYYGLSVGSGYQRLWDNGLSLTLDGRLNYADIDVDSYTERGANGLNLAVDEQHWQSLTLTLGGEVSRAFSYDWGVLIPRLRLEYEHQFEDDGAEISFRFANALSDDDSSASFDAADTDSDYFRIGAGVTALFSEGRSAFFSAESTLGQSDVSDHRFNAGIRLEF